MKIQLPLSALIIAIVLFSDGCREATDVGGPSAAAVLTLGASADHLLVLEAYHQVTRWPGRAPGVEDVATVHLSTRDSSGKCYGGRVSFNGVEIPPRWMATPKLTYYDFYDSTGSALGLTFDGSVKQILVEGGGACFPRYTDSIASPSGGPITLLTPAVGDTVDRNSGLTMSWTGGTGRVFVELSNVGCDTCRLVRDMATATSLTLTPAELQHFSAGKIGIYLQRYRYWADSSGGIKRVLAVATKERTWTWIR